MNRNILITIILFLIFPLFLTAQKKNQTNSKGYLFSIKIKNFPDTVLYFGEYYMGKQYSLDTAYLNEKGIFVFHKPEVEIHPGLYFFTTSKGKFFEIFLAPEKEKINFEIEADTVHLLKSMKIKGSLENSIFIQQKRIIDSLYNALKPLDSLRRINQLSEDKYNSEKERIDRVMDNYNITFIQSYPDHSFTKMMYASKDLELPTSPKDKYGNYIDADFSQYLQTYTRKHYFNNVPLEWDGIVRMPSTVFNDRFNIYFDQVLKDVPVDTIIFYTDKLIEKTSKSPEVFKYIVWYITNKYLRSLEPGHDAVYVHMVENYYMTGRVFWAAVSAVESESKRALKWKNLLIGKPAPELKTMDLNGQWASLYDIRAKFTILAFWSPDCGHCKTEIPALNQYYKENKEKYGIEVYAVNAEFSEDEEWRQFIKENNLNSWINTTGGKSNINWEESYDVYKTPMIFLLDEDKKFLGKNLSVEMIQNLIRNHNESK